MDQTAIDNQLETPSDFEKLLASLLKKASGSPYQSYSSVFTQVLSKIYNVSKFDPSGNFSIAYLLSRPGDNLKFEISFYDGNSILDQDTADPTLKLSGYSSMAGESKMGEQTSSRIRVPNDSTVRFEVRQGQMAQIGGFSIPSTGKISIKLSSNDPEFSVSVDVPYFGVLGASKGTTSRKLQIPLVNEANSGRYAKNKLPIVHASMEIKDIDKEHLELIRFNLVCHYENSISSKPFFDNLSPPAQFKPITQEDLKQALEDIPGAVVVNQGGKPSYSQGINKSEKMQIGNITRLFVALALKKLVPEWKDRKHDASFVVSQIERKHPELAEQLHNIYSEQTVPSPTVDQLLSGTSGLPEDFGIQEDGLGDFISNILAGCHVNSRKDRDCEGEFLKGLKNCELAYLPGSHVCSSNVGWVVLMLLLESLVGSSCSVSQYLERVAAEYGYESAEFPREQKLQSFPIFSGGYGMRLSWEDISKLARDLVSKKLFKKFLRARYQDPCDAATHRTCLSDWKITDFSDSTKRHLLPALNVTSPCDSEYGHISFHCFPSIDTSVVLHADRAFDNTYSQWAKMALNAILSGCLSGQKTTIRDSCKPVSYPPFYRKMPNPTKSDLIGDNFQSLVTIDKLLEELANQKALLIPLFASQMVSPSITIKKLRLKDKGKSNHGNQLRAYRFMFHGIPTESGGKMNEPMGSHSQTAEPDISTGLYGFKTRGPGLPIYAAKGTIETTQGPKEVEAVVISNSPYVTPETKKIVDEQVRDRLQHLMRKSEQPKMQSGNNYMERNSDLETRNNLQSLLISPSMVDQTLESAEQLQQNPQPEANPQNPQELQKIGAGLCGFGYHRVLGYGCVPNAPYPYYPRPYYRRPWYRRPFYL